MWNTAGPSSSSAFLTALVVALAAMPRGGGVGPWHGDEIGARTSDPRATDDRAAVDAGVARPVVGIVPSSDPQITAALVAGAGRALDEARAAGGPELTLVVGTAAAQWASVASEAARLACDERVIALVGPPERALAHPAAQAATRCGVPLVSTSPAPSVTAAGSRWVLSVAAEGGESATDAASARAAGYDAARVVVEAVRRAGLSRAAVLAAAREGTVVTADGGRIRFDALGRRESASD